MSEQLNGRRKYTLDLDPIFEDSHAKYYWLGFLSADGNVATKEPRIRVELREEDSLHL